MNNPFRSLSARVVAFAGIALAMSALASAFVVDELSVQGGSSTGGDAYTIVGRSGGELRFSVTGRFNDVAELYTPSGYRLFARSIRDIWNGATPLQIVDKFQLADGRSRILLRVPQADPSLNGGRVRLVSGNTELDWDPIYLR